MICRKKRYMDELSAKFALSQARRVGNYKANRNECRVYYCPKCKGWHLTSKRNNKGGM
jgi:hypothetical protein